MHLEPPSRAAALGTSIGLTTFCIILVILRFYSRFVRKTKLRIDDWLCLVSLLLLMGMAAAVIAGVAMKALTYPIPHQAPDKGHSKTVITAKILWALQMMQVVQLGVTKLSFLFLFKAVFAVGKQSTFRIISWIMISLIIGWTIAFTTGFLFACSGKFDRWWATPLGSVTVCLGLNYQNGFVMSDFLFDLMIIFLPIPMVLRLHMSTSRKVAVVGVFALGTLAVIWSLIRLLVYYEARAQALQVIHGGPMPKVDNDQVITIVCVWSLIESALALIAACLIPVYGIFGTRMVEAIVHSARYIVSLATTDSQHSTQKSRDQSRQQTQGRERLPSSNSQEPIVAPLPDSHAFEAIAMSNSTKEEMAGFGKGSIRVDRDVKMQNNMV